ncbi:MAG: DEAD/DEAH box helicase [Haliea sp.]|uniref:type I restriction endonuclease subunit R n=1 Tax=Haliea sp. TaxID=1932666 RepID=UPI000C493DA6|nr:HsdR family type I site-specific deoxyribonuclease [Haliea sp.]MBM68149.1 DEAD/DEAH box helicase [Haliea sp.]|tara:strand:+ start:42796 stop:46083 length:3288 start_codon:yes stop_codon:yes gene_type:complete
MNTYTPNTSELYASHIPALAMLVRLGWEYRSSTDVLKLRDNSTREVLLRPVLIEFLRQHRFEYKGKSYPLSNEGIQQILTTLASPGLAEGLMPANEAVHDMITLGITVNEFMPDGKRHATTVPLVNWQDIEQNSYIVTEELEVQNAAATGHRRPDLVGFLNGIPVVVIEAKRAASGNPNKSMIDESVSQMIRNQGVQEIPYLFAFAQVLVAVSQTEGRYGTTKTPRKFWSKWEEEVISETEREAIKNRPLSPGQIDALFADKPTKVRHYFEQLWANPVLPTEQDELLIGVLSPQRLLSLLRFYILYYKHDKIIARYQQFFGIEALLRQITGADDKGARKGGVIWHTTGSGKSFTMVFLSKLLVLHESLRQCRVIVVTDRVDLEKQLSQTFAASGALGLTSASSGEAGQARMGSGKDLANQIGHGEQRVIFTLVQKFLSAIKMKACHNPSENLLVLVDEGHRSHGGENHQRMRRALPNAAYIAFTGTPLMRKDRRETEETFGPIVHAYTMRRAVDDGTVAPLLYEERRPALDVNQQAIDKWFETITRGLTDDQKADLKRKYTKRGAVYGAENRIRLLAWDIALHFSENFKKLDKPLKGQVACDSKLSAIRYKRFLDETGLVSSRIVISAPDTREGHSEVDEAELPEVQQWWKDNMPGDPHEYERETIEHFGMDGDPDLLIVVDKLLTGFDEPRNAVLYIDKPLKGHNLIQAIARVNRLHEEKAFGLLIDYRGILKELDTAIETYRNLEEHTQGGFDIDDIDGLYANVATEYKQLPQLHKRVWAFFSEVKNHQDVEAYRKVLMPKYDTDPDGVEYDTRQEIRENFYAALTEFGMCLQVARSSRSFFEDKSFTEEMVNTYKRDLKWFIELRKIARQDAQETVDYSAYEKQIRKLVDRDVVGVEITRGEGTYVVSRLGGDPEDWDDEKTRNEADTIRTRTRKTIEQDLEDDPYAKKVFSELLKKAIEEAEALFDHPTKQYALFQGFEEEVRARKTPGIPDELADNPHAKAYFGLFRLIAGDEAVDAGMAAEPETLISLARQIDETVHTVVAQNTLNPTGVDKGIRKALLPTLFQRFGLDKANRLLDQIVHIVRVGLNHD